MTEQAAVATILCALRQFQERTVDDCQPNCEGCDHFAECDPLDYEEIDELCEGINSYGLDIAMILLRHESERA